MTSLLSSLSSLLLFLLSCCLFSTTTALQVVSLDGTDWTLSNTNGSIQCKATVPGSNYLDLLNAGLITEPYQRYNERTLQWIAYEPSWTWRKTFTVPAGFRATPQVELSFDGIDTIAEIAVNGNIVGHSANQFRRAVFQLPGAMLNSNNSNTITVTIRSPVLYGEEEFKRYPYELPVSDAPNIDGHAQLPYRNFLRKVQSDFGWDWGSALGPSGIWKHVEIRIYDEALVQDVIFIATRYADLDAATRTNFNLSAGDWLANVTTFLRTTQKNFVQASLQIAIRNSTFSTDVTIPISISSTARPFDGDHLETVSVLLPVRQPALWWPVNYGRQALYQLAITTLNDWSPDNAVTVKTVGFKKTTIVRAPTAGEAGLSMLFTVNDVPIFTKGSNIVPLDALFTRITADNITRIMQSTRDANANILRVWGGGMVLPELVYDLADQYGILVWQEFLFGCAQYSIEKSFLASVREEVSQIVRFLNTHPSLAVFGGSNENEAMLNWQQVTMTYRDRYLSAQTDLYINTVRDALVREVGLSIEFQASSPTNGPFTIEPYTQIWGNAYDLTMGDNHWYDYSVDLLEVSNYPRTRYMSEFGFQSLPSWRTFAPVLGDIKSGDLVYDSPMMRFRQHHQDGNEQMRAQWRRHFNDPNATDSLQLFKDQLYLTQVQQAAYYALAMGYWRSNGYTKGIIYWQTNDEWQAPSWSGLEYGSRWKVLQYAVKQTFEPMLISGRLTPINGSDAQAMLSVYAVSERMNDVMGSVNVTLRLWATGQAVYSSSRTLTVPALGTEQVFSQSFADFIKGTPAAAACVPRSQCYADLQWFGNDGTILSRTALVLSTYAAAPLADPKIQLQVLSAPTQIELDIHRHRATSRLHTNAQTSAASNAAPSIQVRISSAAPAAWVFVETDSLGYFDQGAFLLLPNEPRTLTFTPFENLFDANLFKSTLEVTSLYDLTHRA